MTGSNSVFDTFFKTRASAEDAVNYLRRITTEFPFFSPAQFCLLQQLAPTDPAYDLQSSKTALLFNNPYWLQFQLQEYTNNESEKPAALQVDSAVNLDPANEQADIQNHLTVEKAEPTQAVAETEVDEIVAEIETEFEEAEINIDTKNLAEVLEQSRELPEPVKLADPTFPEDSAEVSQDESIDAVNEIEGFTEETSLKPTEDQLEIVQEEIVTPATEAKERSESAENITEENTQAVVPDLISDLSGTNTIIDVPANIEAQNATDADRVDNNVSINEEAIPESIEESINDTEPGFENGASKNSETGAPFDFKLKLGPVGTGEETLSFEPLHTTDYFASQGIRLSGEIKTNDRLGKQLKSFTEWLKTMKKVHTDADVETEPPSDANIQKLAEKSNLEDEVVTEAMADVLIQQGKDAKAIEVYKKLSLLNPSKNAYFAAKIEQLKQ